MADKLQVRKPTEKDLASLRALIERANKGEQSALEKLREFLDTNPGIWKLVGDLSRMAENAWIKLISGADALAGESIRRQLALIKEDLVGERPSMIEELLGNQVTSTLLETKHLETLNASTAGTIGQATLLLRRLESAQRRHAASIRSLVQVRTLLREAEARPLLRIFNAEQKTG